MIKINEHNANMIQEKLQILNENESKDFFQPSVELFEVNWLCWSWILSSPNKNQ